MAIRDAAGRHAARRWRSPVGAGLILLGLMGCAPAPEPIEFATIEKNWPRNNYLACPIDLCIGTTDATSPGYAMSVAQLEAIGDKAILSQPGTAKVGGDPARHQFIYQQSLYGVPHTVWVQYYALAPRRSTIAIYAGTGSGFYYDFNTDRDQSETWLRAIHDAAGPAVDGD